MRAKLRQAGVNLALLFASLFVCFLVLEFFVFGVLLKPDDLLPNVTINGVVRYLPNSRAVFRHPDQSETLVTVNAQGWNSTRRSYAPTKPAGTLRVAVIGDSYVHGSFVNVGEGFAEIIERRLNTAGVKAEVLRFGMDGAPLSQYLHMLRHEVRGYRPDVVIVQLIHNDFDESYRFLKTRYASSFLKIEVSEDGAFREIEPADFTPGAADLIREFNTFRYLYYKTDAYLALKGLVSRLWWGGDEEFAPQFIQSGVDIRKIADQGRNRVVARYILEQMQALAREDGFKLAFAMDGVREAIYAGKPPESYAVHALNVIAQDLTRGLNLPFLDLQETFRQSYARDGHRFEFAYDWHWNALANRVAGEAITRLLLSDPRLLGGTPRKSANAEPASPAHGSPASPALPAGTNLR
jgi:hypothetical protein